VCLHIQELQNSACPKHECTAKDARRPKFHGRNRYADVSPCRCLAFLHLFSMMSLQSAYVLKKGFVISLED